MAAFLLLFPFWILVFIVFMRTQLKIFRIHDLKLQFSITDIWALIAGITPTLLLAGYLLQRKTDEIGIVLSLVLIAICALSQLAGAFSGWLNYAVYARPPVNLHVSSALRIFIGSLAGLLLPALSPLAAFLLLFPIFLLAAFFGPLAIFLTPVLIIILIALYKWKSS